nr:3'-5' exonuclease [Pseudoalteromonas spongiae]
MVSKIKAWFEQGNALQDCAILYRNNAQSRVLESELNIQSPRIPYRIYGGMRFFRTSRNQRCIMLLTHCK